MVLQPKIRHFFVFRARATIVGIGVNADATAGSEDTCNFNVFGIHQFDEVFHDDIDAVFVEVTVVAEREEVEFEGFAFHHALVGQVGDADFSKVGLSCDGTQGGELGAVELHPVVVFGVFILKGF